MLQSKVLLSIRYVFQQIGYGDNEVRHSTHLHVAFDWDGLCSLFQINSFKTATLNTDFTQLPLPQPLTYMYLPQQRIPLYVGGQLHRFTCLS